MPAAATLAAIPATHTAPSVELADIIRRYGRAYQREYHPHCLQVKVMNAIASCRTKALGGHVDYCGKCGYERYTYNSCRNRHCPKCQSLAKAQWLEDRKAELLPVPYFHSVFTLPHELNALVMWNKEKLLKLLFDAAAQTLLTFGRNNLGGQVGFSMVLHTWDQHLRPHFHVHAIIAGGALDSEKDRWIAASTKFLFAVRALSKTFRGKFMDELKRLYKKGSLRFPGAPDAAATAKNFQALTDALWSKEWIVYMKAPFADAETALDYLGRYTQRVGISNDRILASGAPRIDCTRLTCENVVVLVEQIGLPYCVWYRVCYQPRR